MNTVSERKSVKQERQEQAEAWMKLKLEIVNEEAIIDGAQMKADNLKNALERVEKELRDAVGVNQREKIYDVRRECGTNKLVRVRLTVIAGDHDEPAKEEVRIDTIEIEDRE